MKILKILVCILSMILMFSLCACNSIGTNETNKLIGSWSQDDIATDNRSISRFVTYEFFEDGSYFRTVYDMGPNVKGMSAKDNSRAEMHQSSGKYTVLDDTRIKINDTLYEYSIKGKKLYLKSTNKDSEVDEYIKE